MNKLIPIFITALFFLQFNVNAATVEVEWTEPDEYRDIYPGNENTKKFRERFFSEINDHLIKLAGAIPQRFTLKINVTDVDLAGDVHAGGINQVRIIKDIYSPRMELSFELLDENKNVVHSGNEKLKDMAFMMSSNLKYRHRSFSYEKQMLDDWFDEKFANYVKK